ncbi:hypothetical protein, partial [Verminephrobacter aporrectodeae]|uniref:hypothetical protein n=2 Tax=Verminephrobacter aporrectodeae TaxID=1110389 RepID=UPI0022444C59
NRTVKRPCADDSAGSRVKVGHRQAITALKPPSPQGWGVCLCAIVSASPRRLCSKNVLLVISFMNQALGTAIQDLSKLVHMLVQC